MRYFIYIDESGPFDEKLSGARSSFVGGICSDMDASGWRATHEEHLAAHNQKSRVRFSFPDHYHCGSLLGRSVSGPLNASDKDLRDFTESVYHNVLSVCLFAFGSKNRGKRFEYSPQATYVMNLIAALRCAFQCLAELRGGNVDRVSLLIAQRSIAETTRLHPRDRYMTVLLAYVRDQLLVGEGDGVELARRLDRNGCLIADSGIGDRDPGLIAADFVCCLLRQKAKVPAGATVQVCSPDAEVLLGDYRRFHERQVDEFLRHAYYGSCLDFMCRFFPGKTGVPDVSNLLRAVERQTDTGVLEREMPALLSVVHHMAKHRTHGPHLLACATAVAENLVTAAERNEARQHPDGTRRTWLNLHVQALGELVACYNHTGAVGPQRDAEVRLESILREHGKDTGLGALERQSWLLEIRNRNLNLLFNDYRFEEAYTAAEDLVAARREMVGADVADKMLGEMLGSYGQACAFMGRIEAEWNAEAERAFRESLRHFAIGSRQETMSRNFIATVYWQSDRLVEAFSWLRDMAPAALCEEKLVPALQKRLLEPDPEQRAFDVVNCLRLVCRLQFGKRRVLTDELAVSSALESVAGRAGTDHPYEQWWKWLGVLHLVSGRPKDAERCLARGEALCGEHSFTMRTIGSSLLLLRFVVASRHPDMKRADELQQRYRSLTSALMSQSSGFRDYMGHYPDIMHAELQPDSLAIPSEQLWRLCTYLPFAYS